MRKVNNYNIHIKYSAAKPLSKNHIFFVYFDEKNIDYILSYFLSGRVVFSPEP